MLIFWVIAGLLAGTLARRLVPGERPLGVSGDLILGMIGAVGLGWLSQDALGIRYGGWIASALVAFGGAVMGMLSLRLAIRGRTA